MSAVTYAMYAELLKRPVAYHPVFRRVTGSTAAAVMASQMYYWSSEGRISAERDGWFHKTIEQWEEETGLSRSEQNRARRDLLSAGVLEEVRKGNPARMWFRLKVDALLALVAQFAESCNLKSGAEHQAGDASDAGEKQPENINENNSLQNPANKNAESCKQDCTSQQSSMQNPANYLTETTTEITSETTCAGADAPASSMPVIDHADQPASDASTEAEDPFLSSLFSPVANETLSVTAAAGGSSRPKFQMHFEWYPSEMFQQRHARYGAALGGEGMQNVLEEFQTFWEGRGDALTQGEWEAKFLKQLQREYSRMGSAGSVVAGSQTTRQQKREAISALVMDGIINNDHNW